MQMRKRNWKKERATSLVHSFELAGDYALEVLRRPPKQMAELMDTSLPTYYRWISEGAMPASKIRQFEHLCGCHFVSDYLALAAGRMVVEMPVGKRATESDIAALQSGTAQAIHLVIEFYAGRAALDETTSAMDDALRGLSFHRANVTKLAEPELDFGEA